MSDRLEQQKDRTFALACVAIVGCVAIVAILGLTTHRSPEGSTPNTAVVASAAGSPSASLATTEAQADAIVANLKSVDGQPLISMSEEPFNPPARPANSDALPVDNPLHWYDMEYSGFTVAKQNIPKSPANGAQGKKVICLLFMDHPYLTAYTKGMQAVADAYGIQLTTLVANDDVNIQSEQVDQAINEHPDMIIITPVDSTAVVPMLRRINQAGIPVIASNVLPNAAGMPNILTWTGPDDWGNMHLLAHEFAKRMHYQGGYCIVRHIPGSSNYFARTYGMITELKKIAPKMVCLDMQPTGLQAERTMQVVSDWITRYRLQLKGIVSSDDSGAQIGIDQAVTDANREDIVRVAAGNSKVGMDAVKAGEVAAITVQPAESDGAIPMKLAADWFYGKPIQQPVYYLKQAVITKANVDQYLPSQW